MFQRFPLFALLLCLFALSSSAPAWAKDSPTQAADRRAIAAAYSRLDGARTSKNIDRIAPLIADDFRFYTIARLEQDRETYLRIQDNAWKISRNIAKTDVPMRFTTQIARIDWRGPDAVVYTTLSFKTTGSGVPVSGQVRSREYWGKTRAGWQVRQIVELSANMNMAGETIEM